MALEESTDLTQPFFSLSPDNFRRMFQSQINATVNKELNTSINFGSANRDGRYNTTKPGITYRTANDHGFKYFVVGFSTIDNITVVAP